MENELYNKFRDAVWRMFFKNDSVFILKNCDQYQIEKASFKILEDQMTDLQTDYNELNTKFESLVVELDTPEAPKPEWLDDRDVYPAKVRIAGKDGDYTVSMDQRNIYTQNKVVEDIVREFKWKSLYLKDKKLCAYKIWSYVILNIKYVRDKQEDWRFSPITLSSGSGDCIAEYERIQTKEGLKQVKDLEEGDIVLSYDFENKKYVYKPITKIWEKGEKEAYRVHLRNGTHTDFSDEHKLLTRKGQTKSVYEPTRVKDVDLTRWNKRKVPVVKELPYEIIDNDFLTEDMCYLIGNFIADGWKSDTRVCFSGHLIPKYIKPILDKYGITYHKRTNKNGVPIYRLHKCELSEYLKTVKEHSFDIHLPEEIFHIPKNKLKKLLEGYFLGDGHFLHKNNNTLFAYSTISTQLSKDLQRIHLQFGEPIYKWLQVNHGGLGKHPIYRLEYNTNSCFSRDYGYEGLSEVGITKIEPIGKVKMRDFEVADTNLFITESGQIVHNCEDSCITFVDLAREAGFKADEVFNACGYLTDSEGNQYGHSYPILNYGDGFFVYESTLVRVPAVPKRFIGSEYSADWGICSWLHKGHTRDGTNQI